LAVYAKDVDGDGDMDVLSTSYVDAKIAWYENDGNENFSFHTITTNSSGARSVFAIDVDGDGDMDVLSASEYDDKIAWYENLLIVGIADKNPLVVPAQFQLFNNYPNPFNPSTNIQYVLSSMQFVSLKIYDVLGNEVATLVSQEKSAGNYEVEFSTGLIHQTLPSGVYFYQLRAGAFIETKKMILLK